MIQTLPVHKHGTSLRQTESSLWCKSVRFTLRHPLVFVAIVNDIFVNWFLE